MKRILRTISAHRKEKGFTLLELMFVIAIFAVMASIILFKFQVFGTAANLDNLAQDIALRVIDAQKSAISGLLNPGLTGSVPPSYGVYFVSGSSTDTANHQFTYFADLNGNKLYDDAGFCPASPVAGNECISVTSITTGEYVSNICYATSGTTSTIVCSPGAGVHITFTRPFPDATMEVETTPGATAPISVHEVYVELTSGINPNLQETIIVTDLGEVRVYNGCEAVAAGGTSC